MNRLDEAVGRVVAEGNCSGCGMCAHLDSGLEMELDAAGFSRPVRARDTAIDDSVVRDFEAACPGVTVSAQRPEGAIRHPTMGPVVQAWRAWANDPEFRFAGSSGGTLSALAAWLTTSGREHRVIGAAQNEREPRRTVSVSIMSREEALAAAGSRYAPVSTAASFDEGSAFCGKPCEASAVRALSAARGEEAPLLLSFFCAGTPSQHATEELIESLGIAAGTRLESLRYRGNGWPGEFIATSATGDTVSTSYEESWGKHLGRAVQWRCKVCADGVGESADVTAADQWQADESGYPTFLEGAGTSALIARTRRGQQLVLDAVEAGVLTVEPMDIAELAAVQPLQRDRRETLAARLAGTRLAGGRVPQYRGFGLLALSLRHPRLALRVARATRRRRLALSST